MGSCINSQVEGMMIDDMMDSHSDVTVITVAFNTFLQVSTRSFSLRTFIYWDCML